MGKLIDLTGKSFGRLEVIQRAHNKGKHPCWICKCECGNVVFVVSLNLRRGDTRSCGCLLKDYRKSRQRKLEIEVYSFF